MTRPLSLLAGILGVVFLAAAGMYALTPAGGLPTFFPGFEAGSATIHLKHALGSGILGLVCIAFAWFQGARGRQ
jgi:hypothetical protein